MIDSNIPLRGVVPKIDVSSPLNSLMGLSSAALRNDALSQNIAHNEVMNPLLQSATQMRLDQQEQGMTEDKARFMLKDAALDAVQGKSLLSTNPQAAKSLIARRIQKLDESGRDSTHTRNLLRELEAGNMDFVQSEFDAVILAAERGGLLGASGLSNARFGRTFVAEVNGEKVFAQTDSDGNVRVHDGIVPPTSVAEMKFDRDQQKSQDQRQSTALNLANTANQFAQTLSDSNASGATGVEGVITGNLGRLTGSQEGVLKARIERQSRKMVLQAAEALKGTMSDGDVRLLEETMPKGSDDIAIWEDWYQQEFVPTVRSSSIAAGIDFESLGIPLSIGPQKEQETSQEQPELSIDELVKKYGG